MQGRREGGKGGMSPSEIPTLNFFSVNYSTIFVTFNGMFSMCFGFLWTLPQRTKEGVLSPAGEPQIQMASGSQILSGALPLGTKPPLLFPLKQIPGYALLICN